MRVSILDVKIVIVLVFDFFATGFILDKRISTNCPKVQEKAKIMIANTCASFNMLFYWKVT